VKKAKRKILHNYGLDLYMEMFSIAKGRTNRETSQLKISEIR